ncbi:MAG: cysteine--tRNA ligase [Patescibacteria group bacterium]|nr:cysteine--tRNA ligase [Patescibacteria group bacterium]
MLKIYNTLSRKKEVFKPLKQGRVGLYTCGPTVYLFAHIGNLRTYIFEDILKRVLKYNKFKVKHVMNITDVGHLTSDADTGEDKMLKALKREGKELNKKSMFEIADFYTKTFKKDLKNLNISEPDIWCKVTDYIKEQIDMIKKLVKNGYAYETNSAVYFDTLKLKEYTELAKLDLKGMQEGISVDKKTDKKNPTDFALWLKLIGEHKNHIMNWDSPWGKGFPGWHIECSAMSIKHLGKEFDIHCGGIDHIPVHHSNERAQNIGALNKPAVKIWMHGEFLILKQGRMGKSEGNIIILDDLIKKDFNPLAYRYLTLNAHYRSKLTFSLEDLKSAQNALDNLYEKIRIIKSENTKPTAKIETDYKEEFLKNINDDLNMPKALALTWDLVKDKNISSKEKYKLLLDFDKIFGLGLDKVKEIQVPKKIKDLAKEREQLRSENKWQEADEIRKRIEKLGYKIEDTNKGTKVKKL